ncbi:hypothetical protein COLO4_09315, partial [Corchorus olitorius]
MEEEGESGEVASKFRGNSVVQDANFRGVAELPYMGNVVDHGLLENDKVAEVAKMVGAGPSVVEKPVGEQVGELDIEQKKVEDFLPLKVGVDSAEYSALERRDQRKVEPANLDAANLANILGQFIPGIGPAFENKIADGIDHNKLGLGGNCSAGRQVIESPNIKSNFTELTPSPTFAFEAGESGKLSLGRKWKKAARVSKKYSFDFLAQASNIKEGRKRSKGISLLDVDEAGVLKRSKERESQIEDRFEDPGDDE